MSEETPMYRTKYALTAGIERVYGDLTTDGYLKLEYDWLRVGRDVFADLDAAKADAEKRRVAKIASVRKQLAKLESLAFDTVKGWPHD